MPFSNPTTTLPGSDVTGPIERFTPNGGRIVLDVDGAVKTYDANGNPTNYMGGDLGIFWNNSGWDADHTPDGEWFAFWDGNLQFGLGNPGSITDLDQTKTGSLGVLGIGWAGAINSPGDKNGVFTDQAVMVFLAGKPSGQSGTVNAPAWQFQNGDVQVADAVVKLSTTFDNTSWRRVPETWHTPGAFGTGWAGTGTLNGTTAYRSISYRQDAEDNVVIHGAAVSTGTSATIFTLPAGYLPAANNRPLLPAYFNQGGVVKAGFVQVTASGGVSALPAISGVTVAAGTEVYINGSFPLGNIA